MTKNTDSPVGTRAEHWGTYNDVTDPTITRPIEAADHRPPGRSRHWLLRAAAVGYSLAWIVGLFLVSSSTDVTSSGSAIVREDTPHVAALTLQFLLTEGVAALALLVVVIGLRHATAGGGLRGMTWVRLPWREIRRLSYLRCRRSAFDGSGVVPG